MLTIDGLNLTLKKSKDCERRSSLLNSITLLTVADLTRVSIKAS